MENKLTLADALCAAQSEFTPAAESGANPHFRSTFSTMTDLIRATRPALKKHGLAVTQFPDLVDGVHVLRSEIKFRNETVSSCTPIVLDKPSDQQAFGKATSYLCRYVYKNMLGVESADEDDDGNESAGISTNSAHSNTISDKQLALLKMMLKTQPEREAKLCAHYKIDSLSQLSWKHMNEVVTALKPKE